jgi:two-component system sensor histidine kinase DesK
MTGPVRSDEHNPGSDVRPTGLRARSIVLVVLGCGAVAQVADSNVHPSYAYVPFVLVLYLLPFWYASGRRRDVWDRYSWGLLLLQAVGTYLPFVIFGHNWVGGASALLGGLVLLAVPGRRGWSLFVALAALEICCWLLVGLPYDPAVNAVGWVLISFTFHGLTLYGLTRLADLVDRLDATRTALAEAAVTRLRLAATERVSTVIVQRLNELTVLAEKAVRAGSPDDARHHLAAAGQVARQASADARRLVVALPETQGSIPDRSTVSAGVSPALTRAVNAAVTVCFAGTFLLNIAFPVGVPQHSWGVVVIAFVVAAAVIALQWRHVWFSVVAAQPLPRPLAWPWTLAAQAALCLVLYPAAGAASIGLLAFPCASGLLLIRHWTRWLGFAAIVVGVPVLTLLGPADLLSLEHIVTWSIYAAATEASACLLIYGLAQLTRASSLLEDVRRDLADGAAAGERLRLARDTHDTLGLGLSTVALKTDLAAALLDRDPARAHHEIAQLMYVAGGVTRDALAVTTGQIHLNLERELDGAVHTLRAAGITTSINRQKCTLAPPTCAAFAAVTREAVTNVLRHSHATTCTITLTAGNGGHTLAIINDGSGDLRAPGQGLTNMTQRIEALGGAVRTHAKDGEFTVTAVVPHPAASCPQSAPAAVGA